MFDVSARPFVLKNVLAFSVFASKFVRMVGNMEESFGIPDAWLKIPRRIVAPEA